MSNSTEGKRLHLKIILLIQDNIGDMVISLNLSKTQLGVNPRKKKINLYVRPKWNWPTGLKQQHNKNIQKKPKLLFVCTIEG